MSLRGVKRERSLLICICLAGILLIVPYIESHNLSFLSKKGVVEKDILFKTIGEAKILLSNISYITADIYYHGGLGRLGEEEGCVAHREDEHEHVHEHVREHAPFSKFNILARLAEKIEFHEHRHLSGGESKETLPWFYYAVKLNPHNINAYVVGGYWAGSELERPDEGIKFLKEGLRYNPDSWEILAEIAHLYFRKIENYEKAIIYYEKAQGLLNDKNSDKYDRRRVLTFLGVCYEKTGDNSRAVDTYRKILKDFPDNETLIKKIKDLNG